MILFFSENERVRKAKIFFLSLPSFFIAKSYVTALFNNNSEINQISRKICNNIITSFFLLEKKKKTQDEKKDSNEKKIDYGNIQRFKEYINKTKKICHTLFRKESKELVKQNKGILNFPTTMTLSSWGTAFNITFYIIALVIGTPFAYATPIFIFAIGLLFIFCAVSAFFGRPFINHEVKKIHEKNLEQIHNIDTNQQLQTAHTQILQENEKKNANDYGKLSAEESGIIETLNANDSKRIIAENSKSLMEMQSFLSEKPHFDF